MRYCYYSRIPRLDTTRLRTR